MLDEIYKNNFKKLIEFLDQIYYTFTKILCNLKFFIENLLKFLRKINTFN